MKYIENNDIFVGIVIVKDGDCKRVIEVFSCDKLYKMRSQISLWDRIFGECYKHKKSFDPKLKSQFERASTPTPQLPQPNGNNHHNNHSNNNNNDNNNFNNGFNDNNLNNYYCNSRTPNAQSGNHLAPAKLKARSVSPISPRSSWNKNTSPR